jgi:hypothetical protein
LAVPTNRIHTDELLARANDPQVTARTLEYWRQEGLLPKAERTGQSGKRPEWTYPAEAAEQLDELLRLRRAKKQPDVLRVAMWFRGYHIDLTRIGPSIVGVLRRVETMFAKEIEKRRDPSLPPEEATASALEKVARTIARKRGAHAAPRFGRQLLRDRERGISLLLSLALGYPEASTRIPADAAKFERLTGLDQARRNHPGLQAWLSGPAGDGLESFESIASLPALIRVVGSVSDEELLASRDQARTLLDAIRAMSRIADAFSLTDNTAGLAAWEVAAEDPAAAAWLIALTIALRQTTRYDDNLRTIVNALDADILPISRHAGELAKLDDDELRTRLPELERMPFIEQARIKNLLTKYRETE